MMEGEEVRLKELPPEVKAKYYACVIGTVLLAVIGWAFAMRDQLSRVSFELGGETLREVKEGVAQITQEVKANTQEPNMQLKTAAEVVLTPLATGVEEREEAMDIVGGIMKEQLDADAAETSTNEETADAETNVTEPTP